MGASTGTHGGSDRDGPGDRRRGQSLLIAGFIVLAVLVVGLAYWAWLEQARTIRDSAENSLVAVAELKADQIAVWLGERRGDAETIRSDRVLAATVADLLAGRGGAAPEADVRAQLAAVQEHGDYVDVVLVDRDGRIVVREPEGATHALGAEVRALARTTLRTGRVEMTDLYLDAGGEARLEIAAPVLADEPGAPAIAAVVLHIDPRDYLYPLIQDWPLESASGETLLVQRRGDEVLFLNELRHRTGTALRLASPLSDPDLPASMAVRGLTGIVEGIDYRGVPVIAALQPVPDAPWFVVAKMDTGEVLGPIESRAWLTAGFTLLVVVLAAAGTLLLWRARERRVDAERRQAEAANSRLAAIVESSDDAIYSRTLDGTITTWNEGAERLYGYAAEEIVGRSVDMLLLPDHKNELAEQLEHVRQGTTVRHYEAVRVRRDGSRIDVSLSMSPIKDEAGGVIGASMIVRDVSEQHRAEAEVRRLNNELEQRVFDRTAELDAANKELEAFAYSVSHDLRAPLRHVSGFAGLLAERTGKGLDDKSRHYVARISASVHEMGVLIDDLLQFSRTGRAELKIEPVDMDASLAEALEPLQREADGRDIEWAIAPLPDVVADRALLRQVWANLLGNAVKYTRGRAPARIEIGSGNSAGVGVGADGTVFWVRDNGVGFDMEYAHKLFGVFQRLHSTAEFEGTGIGLANVHRIITRLGGRVWAEGEIDEGAAFFFTLPQRKEAAS